MAVFDDIFDKYLSENVLRKSKRQLIWVQCLNLPMNAG